MTTVEPTAAPSFVARLRTLSWVHRVWFLSALLLYFVYLVTIPPFQTNDEDSHWYRMWTVAEGHLVCQPVPETIRQFIMATDELGIRFHKHMYHFSNVDQELALHGNPARSVAQGPPCLYLPLSYVVPALLARLVATPFDPAQGSGMFAAFYVARLANLTMAALAVLLLLAYLPALRNLGLLLYSLPMAIHQSISINQESTILLLFFSLLILWWSRPSLKQIWWMWGVLTLLTITKPVYFVLFLLWAAALVRLHLFEPTRPRRQLWTIAAAIIVPLAIWLSWSKLVINKPENRRFLPSWVNMPGQVNYLVKHPLQVLVVIGHQFIDLFSREHMRGGWISVIGVLGWADYELPNRAYYGFLLAALLAIAADFLADERWTPPLPQLGDLGGRFWARIVPLAAFLAIIPAIAVAMYVQFTGVGGPFAVGCSGRYLHVPYFGMLALGIAWARDRYATAPWARRARPVGLWLSAACVALVWFGNRDAVLAIVHKYYSY